MMGREVIDVSGRAGFDYVLDEFRVGEIARMNEGSLGVNEA